MKLCLINHSFKYELEKLIRIFLPFEKVEFSNEPFYGDGTAVTRLEKGERTVLSAVLRIYGKIYSAEETLSDTDSDYENECERLLAVALYRCFTEASGYIPKWGILTGVRPAKLFSRLSAAYGDEKAADWFKNALMADESKISLCRETVESEKRITGLSLPCSFSLYISVPFCPSRCSYCSFVSHSVEQAKGLIPRYVDLLVREIEKTAEISASLGLRLETVYIGGGTPTSLTAVQLSAVMSAVAGNFDLSHLREYTVEAGRPDTVTAEKLKAIKALGVTRISINPQTMNDRVLERIGRRHTSEDTVKAFMLARKCGFDNINTDLIAGLPGDDFESFRDTLRRVLELEPESVTVHSLAMKKASTLNINGEFPEAQAGKTADMMVEYARKTLTEAGIFPYYMYRQSKTVGNLENVGYSKRGSECLYNVFTMDETHSVLACGASAVTKLREPNGGYIERIFNYKYPYEYISRFGEILAKKDGITVFYEKYSAENK